MAQKYKVNVFSHQGNKDQNEFGNSFYTSQNGQDQ